MYRKGDVVRQSGAMAIRWYGKAAAAENVAAMHWLARIYGGDEDYPEQPDKGIYWRKLASNAGDAQSQGILGVHYFNGRGVRKNRSLAARLYRLSAEQGDTWSQYLLGLCYRDGDGVRRNKRWALHWFERAAVDTPEARKAAKTLRES